VGRQHQPIGGHPRDARPTRGRRPDRVLTRAAALLASPDLRGDVSRRRRTAALAPRSRPRARLLRRHHRHAPDPPPAPIPGNEPPQASPPAGKICTEFNTAAADIRASETFERYDAVHAATRLYVKILRAHPFIDGNLRGTTAALDAALLTLNLRRVQFTDLELHDQLLGTAFVGKHDPYRPLAEHIAEIISTSGEA
jgi:hypothetical protein